MIKYLFFLIIFLIPVGLANAEVGKNFDTENLDNGLIQWTSHYDRVFDGDSWENYILTNDANQIRFKSSGIDFIFDKANCDFKLYDPLDQALAIDSYKFGLSVDAITKTLPICDVVNFIQTDDSINFYIDQGLFKTKFDLEPSIGMEWTHEITNNEGKTSTFTIIETCDNCIAKSIKGNEIDFGEYTLDTKNEIHGTVNETRSYKGDYIIEYEKPISDKEKLIIDPTFSSNNPTEDASIYDSDNDNNCEAVPGSVSFGDPDSIVGRRGSAEVTDCARHYAEYDITSIPDSSQITDTDFIYEVQNVQSPLLNCDYVAMAAQPTAQTDATNWSNIGSGTVLSSNNPICKTSANNVNTDLGIAGDTYIEARLAGNWAAIGIKQNGDVGAIDATERWIGICPEESACTPDPTLRIIYFDFTQNAVRDLIATDIRPTGIDLSWSQPALNGATFHSYQVNKTTPWNSNVATLIVNSTTPTTLSVSSLTGSTQYSFRVGIRATNGFLNYSGNVLNITTDVDPTSSFSTGSFSTLFNGTDAREIFYSRTDINSTSLWLNVTATNTIQLNCNFYYKYSMDNRTYTNIANTSISATRDMATFRFLNVDNEIIDILCWNQYDNTTNARYVITQTHFPFLEQIENFRNGTYGTMGMFGALDFITMIAIIASMIGFNRVNETVGIVFGMFMIGALAVLSNGSIISWDTTFTVGFAVLIMWAIGTTRKD